MNWLLVKGSFLVSIAVLVFFIVAAIQGFSTFERNRGWRSTIVIVLLHLMTGYITAMNHGNPIRDMVVEWPLGQAAFNYISYGLPELYEKKRRYSVINSFCAVAAAALLI